MKLKVDTQQYNILSFIYKTPELRNDLEDIISKAIESFDLVKDTVGVEDASLMIDNYAIDNCKKIFNSYNLSEEHCTLYTSLDCKLGHIIRSYTPSVSSKTLEFYNSAKDPNSKYAVYGEAIFISYHQNDTDIVKFLESNLHLLPDSTKQEVISLKKLYSKKPGINKIINEFEYKSYLASLPISFDKELLCSHIYHFSWVNNQPDRLFTFSYTYKAFKNKYYHINKENISSVFTNISNLIIRTIENNNNSKLHNLEKFIDFCRDEDSFISDLLYFSNNEKAQEIIEASGLLN